ncbi:MAG: helix-turn-helix domain-containing protein [Nitrososphaerota archaeon]
MGRKPRSEEKILSTLLMAPASFKEIVKRTGLPKATVSHAIHRLVKKGAIRPEMINGRITWFITQRGILIMSTYKKQDTMMGLLTLLRIGEPLSKRPLRETDWEIIFEKEAKEAYVNSPELGQKIRRAKDLFAQAWPEIKAKLSMMLSLALMLSLMIREKINDEEDLKVFKDVFIENLFEDIMRPVKTKFLEILEAT